MPIRPPSPDSVRASIRNWARMSRRRAPTALRMPISRVRSRTETSMMFMIPMPPTMSEIEAMPPSSSVSVPLIDDGGLEQLRLVEDREVVVVGRRQARGASAGALVISAWTAAICAWSATLTPIVRTPSPDDEVLVHDPDRDHDLVVGILEPGAALGLEDADQPERQAADRDLAADRARVELEVVGGRGAQHRDPQVLLDRGVGQERALPHVVGADGRRSRRVVPMIEVVVVSPSAPTTAWVCDSGATPATPSIARSASASRGGERGARAAVRAGGRRSSAGSCPGSTAAR